MALRRSSRLKTSKPLSYSADAEIKNDCLHETAGDDSDDEHICRRPRKATRSKVFNKDGDPKWRKTRGKRGMLQQLAEFPLDILFEIFSSLEPYDLLRLSRTTKDLRNILMSKSSSFIWKAARANISALPDIPPDLTEPQYADLAFDPRCHHCDTTRPAQNINWEIRTRSCKMCSENIELYAADYVADGRVRRYLDLIQIRVRKYQYGHRYYICQADQFLAELESLEENSADITLWAQEKIREKSERKMHAELCRRWHESRVMDRTAERTNLRTRRKEGVLDRLRALGWAQELEAQLRRNNLDFLFTHKQVNQPKELTDRIWNNIKDALIILMEQNRDARLIEERDAKIRTRMKTIIKIIGDHLDALPFNTVNPGVGGIALSEVFKPIMLDFSTLDEEVTAETLQDALAQVPRLTEEWRSANVAQLLKLLKEDPLRLHATDDDLELASTVFKCGKCSTGLRYLEALGHRCNFQYAKVDDLFPYASNLDLRAWTPHCLRIASHVPRAVVEACGLDPDTATIWDMDEMDPFLERVPEQTYGTPTHKMVMRWRDACRIYMISGPDDARWVRLGEDEVLLAKAEERRILQDRGRYHYSLLSARCKHCKLTRCDIIHMSESHGIAEPSLEDWEAGLDCPFDFCNIRLPLFDSSPR